MTEPRRAKVTPRGDKQILIERDFDAPARLVWEAWTKPEHIRRWWTADRGSGMTECSVAFRVGGRWRYAMNVASTGEEVAFHGEFLEIDPHSRIVSTEAYEGIPDCDANAATNTLTLTEAGGVTTLTVLVDHVTPEGRDGHLASGMEHGLNDALAILEDIARSLPAPTHSGKATITLEGDRELLIERVFDAPRDLVYRALTEPELVQRWWGAQRGEDVTCEADLRVGGTWRYVMRAGSTGDQVAFHGEYLELVPGERIVSTEVYEAPFLTEEDGSVNTVTLTERDGRTHMAVLCAYRLPEHREMVIASGMESGMQESYDALEDVARSL